MRFLLVLCLLFQPILEGVGCNHLEELLLIEEDGHPFTHDLGIKILKGPLNDAPVMVCLHGLGGCGDFVEGLKAYQDISHHLVSFNFPDHSLRLKGADLSRTSFGTIQELLPAFYVLKKIVVDGYVQSVDLYGFSAGGGAVVNLIAVLNSNRYERELKRVGIGPVERKVLLNALQKGVVVLDCPLKSIDELKGAHGASPELSYIDNRFRTNSMVPIDSLKDFEGLSLNLLVHFQVGDKTLSNRDDDLFISRARHYNRKGNTTAVIGNDGGHLGYHKSLWRSYQDFVQGRNVNACVEYTADNG